MTTAAITPSRSSMRRLATGLIIGILFFGLTTRVSVAEPAGEFRADPDEVGVARTSTPEFFFRGIHGSYRFGVAGDEKIVGDWSGSGTDRVGVRRGRTFYLQLAMTVVFSYGLPSDRVVIGDWDGDGVDTPAAIRGNRWFFRNSNTAGPADFSYTFGRSDDIAVAGDWDGDGTDTPGVYRLSGSRYFLADASGVAVTDFKYGDTTKYGETPVVGDWDGDGDTTVGLRRDPNIFLLRNSNNGGAADLSFGYGSGDPAVGDRPIAGDWQDPSVQA